MYVRIGSVWKNPEQTQRVKAIFYIDGSLCTNGYHVLVLSKRKDAMQPWGKVADLLYACDCVNLEGWIEIPTIDLFPWEKCEGVFPVCYSSRLASYLDKVLRGKYWRFPHSVGSCLITHKVLCVFSKYVPGCSVPAICVVVECNHESDESQIEVRPGTIFVPVEVDYYQI